MNEECSVDMGGGEATLKVPRGGSEVWLGLEISNNGEMYQMTVVERAAMEQKVELSAGDMADALKKSGRVALHGILFDTNKDTIQRASTPVLEEMKRLLDADPSLALVIEGHTDGTGTKDANLALSKKRAAAVKTWLTGRGVEARRLEEKGLGDGAPVGDNRTEEGRAQNRRVELVRKPS
jgi:OOP family OmpA-OmpF porin